MKSDVARVERSETRGLVTRWALTPAFAPLKPGYTLDL
jgi:hypothetical protein